MMCIHHIFGLTDTFKTSNWFLNIYLKWVFTNLVHESKYTFRENASENKFERIQERLRMDERYGFERHKDVVPRTGWLINMHAVSSTDKRFYFAEVALENNNNFFIPSHQKCSLYKKYNINWIFVYLKNNFV